MRVQEKSTGEVLYEGNATEVDCGDLIERKTYLISFTMTDWLDRVSTKEMEYTIPSRPEETANKVQTQPASELAPTESSLQNNELEQEPANTKQILHLNWHQLNPACKMMN